MNTLYLNNYFPFIYIIMNLFFLKCFTLINFYNFQYYIFYILFTKSIFLFISLNETMYTIMNSFFLFFINLYQTSFIIPYQLPYLVS